MCWGPASQVTQSFVPPQPQPQGQAGLRQCGWGRQAWNPFLLSSLVVDDPPLTTEAQVIQFMPLTHQRHRDDSTTVLTPETKTKRSQGASAYQLAERRLGLTYCLPQAKIIPSHKAGCRSIWHLDRSQQRGQGWLQPQTMQKTQFSRQCK